jgi:NAD+ synthase
MKILNHNSIANWLLKQLKKNDGKSFFTPIVGLSGGVDSSLVALLCKYAKLDVLCTNMPCHSSQWSIDRSYALANDYSLKIITVDATVAADLISNQVNASMKIKSANKMNLAGLYSCSRAPILDYVAKCANGLIIGTGNRDEDYILRYFAKRGDGAIDLSPIADLHKSEVRQMFEWIAIHLNNGVLPTSAKNILDAKPSADLWGGEPHYDEDELGLTYDQVEWVDRFVGNNASNFWDSDALSRELFIKNLTNSFCTAEEVELIRKISNIELSTKHKANPNIPICKVRNLTGAFEQ